MVQIRELAPRRPSPAMVVAVASLIAATGGDAVADGVKAVATVVGKNQVTSRSVKDSSLLLADFKRVERAKLKGVRGAPGAKGEPGANGSVNFVGKNVLISATTPFPTQCFECFPPTYGTGTARCDPGQVAVGGGVDADDPQVTEVNAIYPTADGVGWTATVVNDDISRPRGFIVTVLCAPGTTG